MTTRAARFWRAPDSRHTLIWQTDPQAVIADERIEDCLSAVADFAVRLHCYHSERVLDTAVALRPLARLAGAHGERQDGTGYHRGSRADELPGPR